MFGRIVMHKEKINQRRSNFFAEWFFANERSNSMKTQIFDRMVVH